MRHALPVIERFFRPLYFSASVQPIEAWDLQPRREDLMHTQHGLA